MDIRLTSFYTDGNKLHVVIEFPKEVEAKDFQAVTTISTINRHVILRCQDLDEVFFRLRNSTLSHRVHEVLDLQKEEVANDRRLTKAKVADLLFPRMKDGEKKVVKPEPALHVQPHAPVMPVNNAIEVYRRLDRAGINELNFATLCGEELFSKYGSLSYFCAKGTEDEIKTIISNGIS